jgi:hypothetical protein
MNTRCPKYDQLHRDFLQNSKVVQDLNEQNKDFVSHLSAKSGVKASTVKEIISLQDIILTEVIVQSILNAININKESFILLRTHDYYVYIQTHIYIGFQNVIYLM